MNWANDYGCDHGEDYMPERSSDDKWTVENLEKEMDYPSSVERIVSMLNAHDAMLDALNKTKDHLDMIVDSRRTWRSSDQVLYETVGDAIARAEGKGE